MTERDIIYVPSIIGLNQRIEGNTGILSPVHTFYDERQCLRVYPKQNNGDDKIVEAHYKIDSSYNDNHGQVYHIVSVEGKTLDSFQLGRCYFIYEDTDGDEDNVEKALKNLENYAIYYKEGMFLFWEYNEMTEIWEIRSSSWKSQRLTPGIRWYLVKSTQEYKDNPSFKVNVREIIEPTVIMP